MRHNTAPSTMLLHVMEPTPRAIQEGVEPSTFCSLPHDEMRPFLPSTKRRTGEEHDPLR